MLCALDDTWADCLDEFKLALSSTGNTWKCESLAGVDKEAMLSAPEVMDAKTDPGCGYAQIRSLNDLLAKGDIPSAATLQGQELLDVMDLILAKELQYLQGFSLTSGCLAFPYFFKMDLLKEQNPVLHAYCRGVVRTVEIVLRAVMTTGIRSDEEFVPWIREMESEENVPDEQILCQLEEAACKADSPAVATRLRWRMDFLSALRLFVVVEGKAAVEEACGICSAAQELLNSDDYARTFEPVQDGRFFRETEVAYWASGFTPTKPMPVAPFCEVVQSYTTTLQQLASLKDLFSLPSIQAILEYIESIGAQKPLLPVRAIAVIALFRSNPSESFLYGPSLSHRVLEDLSTSYGAPLYLGIMEGKEELLEGVVKYRLHKGMDHRKVTPQQTEFLRQHTVDAVRSWAREMEKVYLIHMECMLCNRGLAHRRLMNVLPQLGGLQEMSYSTDINIFLSQTPGLAADLQNEAIKRTSILTMYANQHVLHVMELIFSLTVELDLFTQGELVPALWYMNFIQRLQVENLLNLSPPYGALIPETRINRVTKVPLYNLALSTRTSGNVDTLRVAILETGRQITDALFRAACVMEAKGLIDFKTQGKYSLTTVERVFNNRMKCLGHIRSPTFVPYGYCVSAKPNFSSTNDGDPPKISHYAHEAGVQALNAAERLKHLLAMKGLDGARGRALYEHIKAMEKTARAINASLASFVGVCDDEEALKGYAVEVCRPFHSCMICLTLRKRTTA
ncbi:hypothetical protein, conserved [Trypanosoma brucei brucei TREU927]|uniref:Mak10 subunit, NatC N(Alpha)-terminal acetyltransferase n=1 Tax=Trypanosoma brucei brucei (strain 927/4 GUTat10.1) TaxID=185431 RepID=Q582D3_TRYB2|nr:hypothetical protein, conserved [Trypanosoma brucei brucei TREU927]AAX80437.1 hypothetical protein, conserved [Trypanosoma brucei]AAZ11347.1 hypothetical protein, conserved [Trypanosoma brucei brucei TREU927]